MIIKTEYIIFINLLIFKKQKRPELIESLMYVLRATNDKKFYEMAVDYLESIERISKIKCGFATVNI
jgi:hypothetical protein